MKYRLRNIYRRGGDVDKLVTDETAYNVDDYAYRVNKLHPNINKSDVQAVYNNATFNGGTSNTNNIRGYYSDNNVTLYNNNLNKDNSRQTLAHEVNHLYYDKLHKGQLNEQEENYLYDAYTPGIIYDTSYGSDSNYSERRATNAELRRRISERNGNVIGADLDRAIDNTSDDDLINMMSNINMYISPDAKKNLKGNVMGTNIKRTDAVRNALKYVAYNNNRGFSTPRRRLESYGYETV